MRIAVFTQDERVYLPGPVGTVIAAMPKQISCVVLSPPTSTHGGRIRGLVKHVGVFGIAGVRMGFRVIWTRLGPRLGLRPRYGEYWSIEEAARQFGIPVFFVKDVNSNQMHRILDEHAADLLVSISCPQIIRKKLLRRFKHGGINVHAAPLPRYRGLLPSFWVLYHGERETAVTVHDLAERLDNGDILLQKQIPIAEGETWHSLVRKTKTAAGELLIEAIKQLEAGSIARRPNRDEDSTYFSFPTWRTAREFRARGGRMF